MEVKSRRPKLVAQKRKFYWNKTKKSLPGWKKNLRNSASWTKRALCARKIGKHHCVGKIFSVYRNRLLEEKRAFVEKYATEVFLQITNAPQKYKGIKIASDYSLLLELTNGETYQIEPGRTLNPSTGQSKVISLSYIAGLNRSSDFAAPVIIDNPLGLFSDEHRAAITRFLPHMGKQVILWSPPVIWLRSIKMSWSRMSKPSISWKPQWSDLAQDGDCKQGGILKWRNKSFFHKTYCQSSDILGKSRLLRWNRKWKRNFFHKISVIYVCYHGGPVAQCNSCPHK